MTRMAVLLVVTSMLGGCVEFVPAYAPVASHTLKVTPEQDADVVWVQRLNVAEEKITLYRCHNAPEGPSCLPAKAP